MSVVVTADNQVGSKSDVNFFEVSRRKLLIMSVGTLSLYGIYWFYKNWSRYNQRENATTWPIARTIFSMFFMHSLCSKIESYHKEKTGLESCKLNKYATFYVLIFLTSFIPEPSGILLQLIFSFVSIIFTVWGCTYIFLKIQEVVSSANGEGSDSVNDKLTPANFFWLAIGCVLYISYIWMLSLFVSMF